MDGGRYAVGSLVQFACRGAHALEGEASIICTETGYWSHPPPFCKYFSILTQNRATLEYTFIYPNYM